MSEMITDLLQFSTLDQQINIETINLKSLIKETLTRIDTQIQEAQATIKMEESCDQKISVDKTLFMNVIQNLVANAIIYCKEEELPVISISAVSDATKITIHIADNGIGIEEPFQDKVFEMFKRLKTKKVDGTGIGLASCKKIVEFHNGKIAVDSTVGVGSTFSIQLPVRNEG